MALKPPFPSLYHYPGSSGPEAFHGVAPSVVFLALVIFDLGDALVGRRLHLGDALPWRRFFLATLALGVSSPRQRLVLTLTPGVDFDLDFVNARIRDGTAFRTLFSTLRFTTHGSLS